MIARLSGKVVEKGTDGLVVDAGGVGYAVAVAASDYGGANLEEDITLHIYEHIRDDAHDLYGFSNMPSRRFFEQLLSVSGVGPKVAMGVLSAASLPQLQQAIAAGDVEVFRGVAGVGKKTAERIMVELKGKVEASGVSLVGMAAGSNDSVYQALVGLGYTPAQAAEAAAGVPAEVTGEQARIKAALRDLR
jgi:Holliday junction DNA helicase RuvA